MLRDHFAPKRILGIGALIILVAYSGWLAREATDSNNTPVVNAKNPDSFVKNLNSAEFDENGISSHVFKTPYLLHYPAKNSSKFKKPYFVMYSTKNDKSPWYVTSDKGTAENGTDIIHLIDNVVIHQPQGSKNSEITIKTSKLTIYPKRNYAETYAPVTIEEPGIVVNSIGMKVYFKEKRVVLLNQARGVYDQQKADKANNN